MANCFLESLGDLENGSVLRSESRLATEPYLVERRVPVLDISPSYPYEIKNLLPLKF